MQGLITIKEAALNWGITERRVRVLCDQGRIDGATKIGPMWIIPEDAKKPEDKRIKSGKYIKLSNCVEGRK